MTRPAPAFAIGEEVIVVDAGLQVGYGIITSSEWIENRPVFDFPSNTFTGWAHHVEGYNLPDRYAAEPNLRKKPRPDHVPADQSFEEIMQNCKQPQGVPA